MSYYVLMEYRWVFTSHRTLEWLLNRAQTNSILVNEVSQVSETAFFSQTFTDARCFFASSMGVIAMRWLESVLHMLIHMSAKVTMKRILMYQLFMKKVSGPRWLSVVAETSYVERGATYTFSDLSDLKSYWFFEDMALHCKLSYQNKLHIIDQNWLFAARYMNNNQDPFLVEPNIRRGFLFFRITYDRLFHSVAKRLTGIVLTMYA